MFAPEPLEHQGSSSARGTRSKKKLSQPATETVSEDPCASFRDSPHDCQAGMPDCEKQTVAFCSACSRVLCGPCSGNHHSAECQLIAFPPLQQPWFEIIPLLSRAQLPEAKRLQEDVPGELREIIVKQSRTLSGFEVGAEYLRRTYCLDEEEKPRARLAPKDFLTRTSVAATAEEIRVKTARRLMREWEVACNAEERHAVVLAIKAFLYPEETAAKAASKQASKDAKLAAKHQGSDEDEEDEEDGRSGGEELGFEEAELLRAKNKDKLTPEFRLLAATLKVNEASVNYVNLAWEDVKAGQGYVHLLLGRHQRGRQRIVRRRLAHLPI